MKFGEYLITERQPGWENYYINYEALKNVLRSLEEVNHIGEDTNRATSLTIPKESASLQITQEDFFLMLEQEMKKIQVFTNEQVKLTRIALTTLEQEIIQNMGQIDNTNDSSTNPMMRQFADVYTKRVQEIGDGFLRLEKYVNINYMGFHKILKKHDKRLPNPCRIFYTKRLQNQSWIRGDYSDVLVSMSRMYAKLRQDKVAKAKDDAKQNFIRSTRKYWVHMEDISEVKYAILQHLPVLLQDTMGGTSDSQMSTSVYVDNFSLELYRGRLEKSHGAIALRFRWYGNGDPEVVYVERKTHREKWSGQSSVKERFSVKEHQVLSLLQGTFDIEQEIAKLRKKGKSEDDIEEWRTLAREIVQVVQSKQLVPTMRTTYMRTAFQIPNDATVRISLDTNLTMMCERSKETLETKRWYRDPYDKIHNDEVTRFPHAVLEVKLQVEDESLTPGWVTALIASGKLIEVNKFSKFIHGCAVLMPQEVYAVPYWIDDVTLKDSIVQSGSAKALLSSGTSTALSPSGNRRNKTSDNSASTATTVAPFTTSPALEKPGYQQQQSSAPPSPASSTRSNANSPKTGKATFSTGYVVKKKTSDNNGLKTSLLGEQDRGYDDDDDVESRGKGHNDANNGFFGRCAGECWSMLEESCFDWTAPVESLNINQQKVEPKLFFANERTFVSWLQMSVIMTSLSVTISALADGEIQAEIIALILFPIALVFDLYALKVYFVRNAKIKARSEERWDDPLGPVVLSSLFLVALVAIFVIEAVDVLSP